MCPCARSKSRSRWYDDMEKVYDEGTRNVNESTAPRISKYIAMKPSEDMFTYIQLEEEEGLIARDNSKQELSFHHAGPSADGGEQSDEHEKGSDDDDDPFFYT